MLLPADSYIVVNKTIITEIDKKILIDLYQPIIGNKSISLYFTLLNDLEKNSIMTDLLTHHHLQTVMQISLEEVVSAREKLEAVGLLKTYLKHDSINNYIYMLYSPLPAQEFLNHPILNVVLYNNIGKKEYEKILNTYKIPRINTKDYEDITASFEDVFASVAGSSFYKNDDIISKENGTLNIKTSIDFELLEAGLKNIINERSLTKELKTLINNLSIIYNLDVLTLQNLIVTCVKENGSIDKDELRKKAKNYYKFENSSNLPTLIYRKQPEYLKTPLGDLSGKAEMIYIFENTTPYNFIKSKYNGGKVIDRDLNLIESLLIDLKLSPGVVNVLLDYTLKVNNQKINKNYVETIASNWKRLGIETVPQAMQACIKEYKKSKKNDNQKEKQQKDIIPEWFNNPKDKKEISEEKAKELQDILSRYS